MVYGIAGAAMAALSLAASAPAAMIPSLQYTGGDTSGCGKTHFFTGLTHYRHIKSGGTDRSYSIHLPASYSPDTQHPLIMGFHGSQSIGFFFEADTRLSEKQFTGDKLVVYPDGLGKAWAGASYSDSTLDEDLQFVWDMLADVRENFCVDSARIYAAGMSMGGGFVNSLACNDTVGGEFAAFAPASGAFYADNDDNYLDCKPARVPVPIVEFHGGKDTTVKYDGGEGSGGQLPAITDWLSRWAERNGCEEPWDQEDLFDDEVHHLSWSCKGQKGVLQHWKSDKQKHSWPSTEPNFSQIADGDWPAHIQASDIIQDFFMSYTRPAE